MFEQCNQLEETVANCCEEMKIFLKAILSLIFRNFIFFEGIGNPT